ncbi:tryptophan-rich antigen [Plasmodium cynomolgi strain B]|uniref:Tryptophan-rich antigen n=1 Tax=Plasmodium cynomolgi (strain B) TaxID=1120755 RepID=K6UVJ7_PLACD|nr:tryptophan-rich antigen [Plasmodium cynomolgi strain B]GAB67539.1 tryptophan-rich antigen [Plasmodium cynomolgi strain B]
MEGKALQNSKFDALNLAAPILNEGINVGKRLIGKLNGPTSADLVLVVTFFTLYRLYNHFKKMKILQPRENHEIIYNTLKTLDGDLSTEEKIQKQLRAVENHNKKVQRLQDWFKDVEKRIKTQRRKIDLATGRAKSDDLIRRAKQRSQYIITAGQEIALEDKEEKEIMENGVKKIQNGLRIIEELIQKLDDGTGKIPKDNLGSYRQEIEIPEDKIAEFDQGLELFEEGLKLIEARVQNTAGDDEIEEIKIELEENNEEEQDGDNSSPYLYSQDEVVQEPLLASELKAYKGKMAQVEDWINDIDQTIRNEAMKIKEGVEAEIKPPESYAQDAGKTMGQVEKNTVKEETHDNEYEQEQNLEEEPNGELTEEWKAKEWTKWMNNTEKEWGNFTQSFEHYKQKWIEKKESEWEEWLRNIHYNWVGFTNKLEEDYINDKANAWTKWNEKEWKGIIEMEWKRPMKVKWTKLVKKNEEIWGDKFFNYWDDWKGKKWNEWKNKNWKKTEEEKWNNFEKCKDLNNDEKCKDLNNDEKCKDLNNDENWKEWKKRLLREKKEWENWVNKKEDVLMDAEETYWKKWKEYKWNYLNEWMKQVEVEWLKSKPWEVLKQVRSDSYE